MPKWLVGFALLWACLAACYQHIPSPDLWWLLADGRLISQTGSIPNTDPFSWSARGLPWHNDQWLAGWLAFQVYRVAGLEGLHLAKALILTSTLAVLLDTGRRLRSDGQTDWLLPALALSLFCAEGRYFFDVRAYLATYFGLALLWRWLQLQERLHPAAVFLLFMVWANLHGGVSSGLLLLGLTTLTRRSRHLFLMTGLATLAACCNPSGIWLLLHPVRLLSSPWGLYLNEWVPAWRRPELFGRMLAALGLAALWGWLARPRWGRDDLVLLLFALFSLTGWRHIPLFALLALPRWCLHLRGPAWCCQLAAVALLVQSGLKPLALTDPNQSLEMELPEGGRLPAFPVQACNWLAERPEFPQKLFHPYGMGGYLLWRGYQVTIDGRAVQVYPFERYRDYLAAALPYARPGDTQTPQRFEAFCLKNEINMAMLSTHGKEAGLWLVQSSKRWRPVYQDDLVTVVITEQVQSFRR